MSAMAYKFLSLLSNYFFSPKSIGPMIGDMEIAQNKTGSIISIFVLE